MAWADSSDAADLAVLTGYSSAVAAMVVRSQLFSWLFRSFLFPFCTLAKSLDPKLRSERAFDLGAPYRSCLALHSDLGNPGSRGFSGPDVPFALGCRNDRLLRGMEDVTRGTLPSGFLSTHGAHTGDHFQRNNPASADFCFEARCLGAPHILRSRSARGQHHQSSRHAAGSGRCMQRNSFSLVAYDFDNHVWIFVGKTDSDSSASGPRGNPNRGRRQRVSNHRHGAAGAILGPR